MSFRTAFVPMASLLFATTVVLAPDSARAQAADAITFDDSGTARIQGADVQAAIESADAEIDTLAGFHEGVAADADVVFLRNDCTGLANCFTSMASLTSWIWPTRSPGSTDPLLVDIGPGSFARFECTTGRGWITLRGSGPANTVIESSGNDIFAPGSSAALFGDGCEQLHVQDLTVKGVITAVAWNGGGSSTWTNVHLIAGPDTRTFGVAYGWYDVGTTCPTEVPLHYFFSSRIESLGGPLATVAYQATCSENWFYGSELLARPDSSVPGSLVRFASLIVDDSGDARVFGSALRTVAPSGVTFTQAPSGGTIDGVFHMHGGIVSVNTSAISGAGAVGLDVESNGFAHTLGTAFALNAGSGGTTTRLTGSGTIQSPLLWQAGDSPPGSNLASAEGQDLYVETDCDSTGCSSGNNSHLMVYDSDCTSNGPWFDIVRGACRN